MIDKSSRLLIILGSFFVANAILAEFIGVKIFSLEQTLGFAPVSINLLAVENLSFSLTAGTILWPVVFIMTDIINEYYGRRGVRLLSFIAVALILYAFFMVFIAINLSPSEFWIMRDIPGGQINMDDAFNTVFGQGLWIIAGSITAFLIGQLIDVSVFHFLKSKTGSPKIWLRATGSTLISQLIDSFVVLFIAFYIGAGWDLSLVAAIGIVNYIYKFVIAILLTPVLYLIHYAIDIYLGKELAEKLILDAIKK